VSIILYLKLIYKYILEGTFFFYVLQENVL
jgi:hypothetical protein